MSFVVVLFCCLFVCLLFCFVVCLFVVVVVVVFWGGHFELVIKASGRCEIR